MAKASENSNVLSVARLYAFCLTVKELSLLLFTFFFREKAANFCFTCNSVFIEKIRIPEAWVYTKCLHGPLVSQREKDPVRCCSFISKAALRGVHQHSPSPGGQPAPAHQTWAKSSAGVTWHSFISQFSTPTAGLLHDSSLLLAKMYFQAARVALRGRAKDGCLCSSLSSFSLETRLC